MSTIKEITEAALQLPPVERGRLIDTLNKSMDDVEFDPSDVAEWARRAEELESGKVKGRTVEESRAHMRERFPWLR
jgi:putative addiction module component (TIGR02574 family)